MKKELTRAFFKIALKIKKHSPEILLFSGIAGGVASTVMACKASTKISGIIEEHDRQMDAVSVGLTNDYFADRYSEDDAKKDVVIIYKNTAIDVFKLYAPSVGLGLISLTAVLAAHNILKMRVAAISAAYAAIDQGFKSYRKNVVNEYGEEVDRRLRNSGEECRCEDAKPNEDEEDDAANKNDGSDYCRCFDELNPNWEKNSQYNIMFLDAAQRYANDKLAAQGYLFLNDVYDMLGIPRSKAGQIVGWVYNNKRGDGYVDFGIKDLIYRDSTSGRVSGREAYWLDFNVDGNILDMI
ncbi:MAG: DUF6353 family protein [Ruminococcus sp.]|nr:DUF6353 family protein [Ruminococcus sp.]